MKFGVHIATWMKTWQDDIVPYIEDAARLGFDGVELSLLGMTEDNIARIRKTLRENQLEVTCTTGLNLQQDITSDDPNVRREGMNYLEHAIQSVSALGSTILSGVIYAPWGKRVMPNRQERWQRSVEALKTKALFAADHGVTLGLEAINRFETDLINTAAQAVQMADDINEKNVGVLLDTYHMNMEEKQLGQSLLYSKDKLVHLHCVENDRGVPGSGHIPWNEVFNSLKTMNYDGWLTLEMFIQADQAVSPDLAIWRDIEPDPTQAAGQGLMFLRESLK